MRLTSESERALVSKAQPMTGIARDSDIDRPLNTQAILRSVDGMDKRNRWIIRKLTVMEQRAWPTEHSENGNRNSHRTGNFLEKMWDDNPNRIVFTFCHETPRAINVRCPMEFIPVRPFTVYVEPVSCRRKWISDTRSPAGIPKSFALLFLQMRIGLRQSRQNVRYWFRNVYQTSCLVTHIIKYGLLFPNEKQMKRSRGKESISRSSQGMTPARFEILLRFEFITMLAYFFINGSMFKYNKARLFTNQTRFVVDQSWQYVLSQHEKKRHAAHSRSNVKKGIWFIYPATSF